jgi:hypothetical protein
MTTTISQYCYELSDAIRRLIRAGTDLQYELPAEDYEDTDIIQEWLNAVDDAKKLVGDK